MKFTRLIPAAFIALTVFACEESSTIGSSIIEDDINIIVDSTFTITGISVRDSVIQARTDNQLLGKIDAKGFGNMSSDFITQFMPSNAIDTVGVTLDSIKMRMFMNDGDLIGDSIIPMGLEIYRVNKALPSPIYSDFNPEDYYDHNSKLASSVYTATILGLSDSIAEDLIESEMRVVDVKLPLSFGKEIYNKYKSDPKLFNDPTKFSNWFPGLYIKNSFGSGRIMRFASSLIYLYYTKNETVDGSDTTYTKINAILSVTPEVINNNNINLKISDNIKKIAASKPTVVAPIGYDVNINIPIKDIISKYKSQTSTFNVINSMSLEIPAEEISNNYDIDPPAYMLLVKRDKKDEFFAKQQINDNITSFYAAYDSSTKSYSFSSMRQYFIDMSKKSDLTDEDGEFVLVPVSLVTETSSTTSSSSYYYYYYYYGTTSSTTTVMAIVPYVGTPAMATLDLDNAKIKITFATQTLK